MLCGHGSSDTSKMVQHPKGVCICIYVTKMWVICIHTYFYNIHFRIPRYFKAPFNSVYFSISTYQGHRLHATIHHDDIHLFSKLLKLHETYYIRDYDLCRSILDSTEGDFYYDILFQSTTSLHHCPPSLVPIYRFVNNNFTAIKSLMGCDTYVVGKFSSLTSDTYCLI